MRVINLGSGSKGNCSFIRAGETRILLDAGFSLVEIEKRLELIGEKAEDIDAILITHEHTDHIKGFLSFLKKYKARGYIHQHIAMECLTDVPMHIADKISVITNYSFSINELRVMPFDLPHDSAWCLGYAFEYKFNKVAFVTDLGYMPMNAFNIIKGSDLIYLESNHDKKMLNGCKYPYIVKKRISGDKGHLSNEQAATLVVELAKRGTKYFVLSHISENSNTFELAYLASARALENSGFIVEKDVFLRYARQERPGNNFRFGENNE